MSRISENIRKITKAWGGKTTGNGISDAVRDLAENLPFGTKTEMVEILPKTSVSVRQSGNRYTGGMNDLVVITPSKNYKVIINGAEHIITAMVERDFYKIKHETSNASEYFSINYNPTTNETSIAWSVDMGCPITVAIYEEQEVVTQLPAKFRGFGEEEVTEEITDYSGEVTGGTGTSTSLPGARFLSQGDLAVTVNGEKFYGTSGTSNGVTMDLDLGKYYLYGEILEPGIKIMGLTPGETYSIQIARVEKKTVVTQIDIKYLPIDELKTALGLA